LISVAMSTIGTLSSIPSEMLNATSHTRFKNGLRYA
jgi:hypothetical protein